LWNDYVNGFQNNNYTNYWMGLQSLHFMSIKDTIVDLRVDIVGDSVTNSDCAHCTWSLTAPFTVIFCFKGNSGQNVFGLWRWPDLPTKTEKVAKIICQSRSARLVGRGWTDEAIFLASLIKSFY
jgi:hypothetical protein